MPDGAEVADRPEAVGRQRPLTAQRALRSHVGQKPTVASDGFLQHRWTTLGLKARTRPSTLGAIGLATSPMLGMRLRA